MRRCLVSIVLLLAVGAIARAEELFPFGVSYGPRTNLTDISNWLDKPAGKHGFVRVKDGHFVTDAGRIRFWATNLCFEACFPSHEQAEKLAARLASFGINCVRMHHMDAYSIWGRSPNKLTIDPEKLDRLDYLIYQLKKHGIYTNINLHVSRWFGDAEGFPHRDKRPTYDKGLDNFEPRMIELQKKYAKDLLAHVNPYTGKPYTDEPAIAFVEISNEDALFAVWSRGELDDLPDPYMSTFRRLWNEWLRQKYGSTERLREAWNVGRKPLGEEMLVNGDFSTEKLAPWAIQTDDLAEVQPSVVPNGGPQGNPCLRLVVKRQGHQGWIPQMFQAGLKVRAGETYTLSGYVRSDSDRRIQLNCMMAHEPWQNLGFSRTLQLSDQWQQFRFTFVVTESDDDARITFTSFSPGVYEFASLSLRPGGIVGVEPGQSLEDGTIPVLRHGSLNVTEQARKDFIDFLWDTESRYWWGMYKYLKEELGVKSLVAGTQLNYSPVYVQAALDYIDAHSYWQHPAFPGRPWDPNNWYVRNIALVNNPGGTLAGLAVRRVANLPFSVSEYNHPLPNSYAAEGFPMLAAFAAFQDWDAIYSFTYSHNTEFEPRRLTGYFDIKSDPTRLVHFPACAAMFLRGDVKPARQCVVAGLTKERERQLLYQALSAWTVRADSLGVDPRLSLLHCVKMALGETTKTVPPVPEKQAVFLADNGQICWDVTQPGAGYFIVATPATKLFTGFVRDRSFDLGDGVRLFVGPTKLDWVTVSMVAVDAPSVLAPGRVLLAASGWVQNTDWQLESAGDDRVTLRTHWGKEPVLCEGVPAEIWMRLPHEQVACYALDEAGNRKEPVSVIPREFGCIVAIGPQYKTLWYELVIKQEP